MPTRSAPPEAIISSASATPRNLHTAKTGASQPAARSAPRIARGRARNGAGSMFMSAICVASE